MRLNKNRAGFTLIELLIVITIIGILAVAFLPALLNAPSQARDTQRVKDINDLAAWQVVENLEKGAKTGNVFCVDDDLLGAHIADFGGKIPADPDSNHLTEVAWASNFCKIPGKYIYRRYASAVNTLVTYYYIATVENEENGNIACDHVALFSLNILEQDIINALSDSGGCYVSFGSNGALYH